MSTCRRASSSTSWTAWACATTRSSSTSSATTARAPKGQHGTISELLAQNNIPNTVEQQLAALDELGGLDALGRPKTDNMYHAGWAWAGNTPFQHTKLVASHFGGTRNPMVISWPKRIKPDKTPRVAVPPRQRHRADDLRDPRHHAAQGRRRFRAGPDRRRQHGLHLRRCEGARRARRTQYFENNGSRGDLPRRLVCRDVRPADALGYGRLRGPGLGREPDVWELYDLRSDFSQADDLAAKEPEAARRMKALFLERPRANKVFPIGARPLAAHPSRRPRQVRPTAAGTSMPRPRACRSSPRRASAASNVVTIEVELRRGRVRRALRAGRRLGRR